MNRNYNTLVHAPMHQDNSTTEVDKMKFFKMINMTSNTP